MKSDYINDVEKTRSPYESHYKLKGVASIAIALPNDKGDSARIGYSLNNHEGSDFVIYFKTGQMSTSLKTSLPDYDIKTNFYELGYKVKNQDTTLIFYHYNKHREIINAVKFTKVLNSLPLDDMGYGIEYVTDEKLISGKYSTVDSTGNSFKIEFNSEGKVTGFLDFKTYYINTDFEAGPENNLDEIDFDVSTPKQKSYTFKFNVDTIDLYDIDHNADSTLLMTGKLKYKLVRQK